MKCMTKYVALDVHQATTVASVRGEGGRILVRTILPTEEPAMVEFLRGMRGEKRLGNRADQPDAGELSELLRRGGLRAVYHGSSHGATLKEWTRSYQNLVEDSRRVMQRLKAFSRGGVVRRTRCITRAASKGQTRNRC